MIVVADAGPLLRLFWVEALPWALPSQEIAVVEEVWQEVTSYAPDALADPRLKRIALTLSAPPLLADKRLHTGKAASLSYALTQAADEQILILSDDHRARRGVSREVAEAALRSTRTGSPVCQAGLNCPRLGRS